MFFNCSTKMLNKNMRILICQISFCYTKTWTDKLNLMLIYYQSIYILLSEDKNIIYWIFNNYRLTANECNKNILAFQQQKRADVLTLIITWPLYTSLSHWPEVVVVFFIPVAHKVVHTTTTTRENICVLSN